MFGFNSVWCYPIACGVILFLQSGTFRCMALLFVASKEWYSTTREDASFPYILRPIFEHFSGPFVGFLGCKFKIPHVILAGCVLVCVSMGACFFAKSIYVLNVLWGVMFGFGCGMSRHLQPVFLSNHFKANFMQANGMIFFGGSIGGLVVPAIFALLLSNYGLPGTFLVYSAICLNAVPAAMVLFTKKVSSEMISVSKDLAEEDVLFVKEVSKSEKTVRDEKYPELNDILHTSTKSLLGCVHFPESNPGTTQEMSPAKSYAKTEGEHLYKFEDLSDATNEKVWTETLDCGNKQYIKKDQESSILSPKKDKSPKIWKTFIVFYDPLFQFIAITQSLFYYTLNTYLMIITDYARDIGIHISLTVYILITFAAGDICARAGTGWIIDKGYISVISSCAICSVCFGIGFSAITFVSNFPAILVLTFCMGVTIGTQTVVHPGIINKFYKGEKKTMAMASRTFYFAPIAFTVPSLIGYFRDSLGSYEWLIYFCSITSIICGVICLLFPIIYRSRCRNKLSG